MNTIWSTFRLMVAITMTALVLLSSCSEKIKSRLPVWNGPSLETHLKQDSILVKVGERVSQGQPIASSGNSSNIQGLPHLHFGVYEGWPAKEGFDMPVNF